MSSLEDLSGPANSFESDPAHTEGGIWASSGAAVDSVGSVYVTTGTVSEPTGAYDLSDGVVKLAPDVWKSDNDADLDLASVGPILIPRPSLKPLLFVTGKQNIGFLLDSSNLGGIGGRLIHRRPPRQPPDMFATVRPTAAAPTPIPSCTCPAKKESEPSRWTPLRRRLRGRG